MTRFVSILAGVVFWCVIVYAVGYAVRDNVQLLPLILVSYAVWYEANRRQSMHAHQTTEQGKGDMTSEDLKQGGKKGTSQPPFTPQKPG